MEMDDLKELTARDRKFCKFLAEGYPPIQAIKDAGFKPTSDESASALACRKRKEPHIMAELQRLYNEMENDFAMSRAEKRIYLARIKRVTPAEIGLDSDLCQGIKVGKGGKITYELPSKLEAIRLDNAMAGHNAPIEGTVNAGDDLLDALFGLSGVRKFSPSGEEDESDAAG